MILANTWFAPLNTGHHKHTEYNHKHLIDRRRPSSSSLPASFSAARQRCVTTRASSSYTPPSLAQDPTPYVDWTRYHLQLLFVDRSDSGRARLAVGLFERVAEWNGFGRVLLAFSSGIDVLHQHPQRPPTAPHRNTPEEHTPEVDALSRTASLLSLALKLGVRPKIFAAPPDQLVREDLDRFDLIVAIDDGIHDSIIKRLLNHNDPYDRQWWRYYERKVCSLPSFSTYVTPARLRSTGGSSLLSAELKSLLHPSLLLLDDTTTGQLPRVQGICRPSDEHSVTNTLQCCAGLVQFLIDSYPPDLPEYDPVD